jgi:hypothetical protein
MHPGTLVTRLLCCGADKPRHARDDDIAPVVKWHAGQATNAANCARCAKRSKAKHAVLIVFWAVFIVGIAVTLGGRMGKPARIVMMMMLHQLQHCRNIKTAFQ